MMPSRSRHQINLGRHHYVSFHFIQRYMWYGYYRYRPLRFVIQELHITVITFLTGPSHISNHQTKIKQVFLFKILFRRHKEKKKFDLHHKRRERLFLTMASSRFHQAVVFLLAALASVGSTDAFVAPKQQLQQQQSSTRANTELYGNTKTPPPLPEVKEISYGEESRQYRRTVFTHDDWIKFRSPNRFTRNLFSIPSSGVYKNLGKEVVATTLVATFVCVWNNVAGGYTDFQGVKHGALIATQASLLMGLPLAPFTLSSPSLGLLLGKWHIFMSLFCEANWILPTVFFFFFLFSVPREPVVQTLGRSSQKLGNEH
jgi:hypothetical protein